jgi:tetratricopeptide (TPR) repeat protein
VKGKAEPLAIYLATAPRSRLGTDVTRSGTTPFVGREVDLAILKGLFDKAVAAQAPQLVTIVGEPGIGKSRIVAELGSYIDDMPGLVTWRQGRCLPYGDGVTFWALGEVVKAHAGILETDDPEAASTKLERIAPDGPEREWFLERLRPLVGLESSSTAEREENFTAWRRFLEQMAEDRPTVVVFEDLHWADEAMLSFLEHLVDQAEGVPLLVAGTARPELYERHEDWGAGLRNATSIDLSPLSNDETARLISGLLDDALLPADVQAPILDRAGGNPLYAQEFVRLLRDRGLLVRTGGTHALAEGVEIPQPDSVQALIAARLDTLPPERKVLLQDAAVIGKVFWAGALAEIGGLRSGDVETALHELTRKELVRRARHSSMSGEQEYSFWHALVRDVAYGQIPRASRIAKHRAAAAWIEAKAGERLEDLADVLAHHYTAALELAIATDDENQTEELREPAIRFLALGGERALDLDAPRAEASLAKAVDLAGSDAAQRPELLLAWGGAARRLARHEEAASALEEACGAFRGRGDLRSAALALLELGRVHNNLNDARAVQDVRDAVDLLAAEPPGPELVAAYAAMAAAATIHLEKHHDAIVWADRALALASELGVADPTRALGMKGSARVELGDAGGLDDMRRAIDLATERGESWEAANARNNYAYALALIRGPAEAREAFHDGIGFARSRGLAFWSNAMTGEEAIQLARLGRFDEALQLSSSVAVLREAAQGWDVTQVLVPQAMILALRGRASEAAGHVEQLVTLTHGSSKADLAVSALATGALVRTVAGEVGDAIRLLRRLASRPGIRDTSAYGAYLPSMVRIAIAGSNLMLAESLSELDPRTPLDEHALVAARAALDEAAGRIDEAIAGYTDAADRWDRFGMRPERGFALLGLGRCLVAFKRPQDASRALDDARKIFVDLGMVPALAEADALIADLSSAAS